VTPIERRCETPVDQKLGRERVLSARSSVAVQSTIKTDDCFGMTIAYDKWIATPPTGLWPSISKVGRNRFHVTTRCEQ
jgi:hypothetical protein